MKDEKLNKMEIDMAVMKEDIKHIKGDISELKETLNKFIDGADGKFAGKWVESAWKFVFTAVGTAVLGAILGLIIIKK